MAQTRDLEQIRRREDLILSQPTRLPPPAEITPAMSALVSSRGEVRPASEIPDIYAVMLHNQDLLQRHRAMGYYFLVEGALAKRDRELVVLRVAWLCQAPFEWGEHVAIGKAVGLTSDDIARVQEGSAAPGWSPHDGALLRAVEELFAEAMISDATWAVLTQTLDQAQLVELPILVGQYQGVAYFLNSMRIRLRESNPGLAAL